MRSREIHSKIRNVSDGIFGFSAMRRKKQGEGGGKNGKMHVAVGAGIMERIN
jgi:hypothetical protein